MSWTKLHPLFLQKNTKGTNNPLNTYQSNSGNKDASALLDLHIYKTKYWNEF